MISGSMLGHMAVWNLEEKRLVTQIREAHSASVDGMQCLQYEPLMVTSSGDNSVKVWIFDMSDGSARLLRQRHGHSQPSAKISFHGLNGHNILSAGLYHFYFCGNFHKIISFYILTNLFRRT